ncbi:MAG: DUF1833 family protein [Candidatus Thiodiazotropha sp. 6PLUC6]
MTPAEKEAYANADDTRVMLYTLELNHPGFTEPLRIVADNDPLTAEIETGESVLFTPFFFSLKRPPISEEPDPSLQITVDNVSGFMTPYLDIASRTGDSIHVIFRPYLIEEAEEQLKGKSVKFKEKEKPEDGPAVDRVPDELMPPLADEPDPTFDLKPAPFNSTITRLSAIKLAIRNASATMTSVTLTAAHINPANLPFPKENYTSDRFPGLA